MMEISTGMAASILGLLTRFAYRDYGGIDQKDRAAFGERAKEFRLAVFPPLAKAGPWFAVRLRFHGTGNFLTAIKALRELTGAGLREARDVVRDGWALVVAGEDAAKALAEHMSAETGGDMQAVMEETATMPDHCWTVNGWED
jgi:ribosomal protein L7/L12